MKLFIFLLLTIGFYACSSQNSYDKSLPMCNVATDLEKHDGKQIYVEGTLRIPKRKRHLTRLELTDSTQIVLGFFKTKLDKCLNKQKIRIRGIIFYKKEIPDKYELFSRMDLPYLLDIESIKEIK